MIIDSGATHHMWIAQNDFTKYKQTSGAYVHVSNGEKAPCLGIGTV